MPNPTDETVSTELKDLTDMARQVKTGVEPVVTPGRGETEIDAIAAAMHQMADELMHTLRKIEAERTAVLDAVVESIIEIDSKGYILATNPATEKLFGYSRAEMVGENVRMLMPDKLADRHDSYLESHLKTGKRRVIGIGREVEGKRKDGTTFPLKLSVARLKYRGETRFVGILADISEQRAHIKELEKLALYDPLTGIPSRRLLDDRLDSAISRAHRTQSQFALLFMDLNGFKPINDQHGHAVGDMVLTMLARRLKESTRDSDTVARFGGDEFVVIAEDINGEEAVTSLVQSFEALIRRGIPIAGRVLSVGVSIGCAVFPVDGSSGDELLREADARMYVDKAGQARPAAGGER